MCQQACSLIHTVHVYTDAVWKHLRCHKAAAHLQKNSITFETQMWEFCMTVWVCNYTVSVCTSGVTYHMQRLPKNPDNFSLLISNSRA